jgi:hypothetical protein
MSISTQLTPLQRWYRVLSRALVKYLNGRELRPPPVLTGAGLAGSSPPRRSGRGLQTARDGRLLLFLG